EDVYARLPAERLRRHLQRGQGIGETRAIDVNAQAVRVRDRAERAHFLNAVNRTRLGGLAQADHAWLVAMHVAATCRGDGEGVWSELAVLALQGDELDTPGRIL